MNKAIRITSYTLLLLSGLFCACSRQAATIPSPDTLVIFPPPPDTARIQFLTRISTSDDLKGKTGWFHSFLFGEEAPLNMIKPYGVTVRGNMIYICDTGLGGLVLADLNSGAFDYFIPGGKGQLQLPINCCLDDRGYLFVADANRRQIVVFDAERNYLHAFGEASDFKPTDVEVHQEKIWVANVQDHAVYVYDLKDYKLLAKLPGPGAVEEGFIRQATNISVHNNALYVSDFGDFNVKKYSLEGNYLGTVGAYGNEPGRFTRPKGIALDREDNLYVVDAAFENVQLFNASGELLMHFGGPYKGAGGMWLPAAVEISYENLSFYQSYLDPGFELKYLIYVTNQYGPAKLNVYGRVEEKATAP